MATIKKPFKIFNKAANTWNKYHLETDSTQVTHTKADGTDTTVAEQLLALNSTYVKETGTSGGWSYRKWSDGTVELWWNSGVTYSNAVASGITGIQLVNATIALPFTISNGVVATSIDWGYTEWTQASVGANSVTVRKFGNANSINIKSHKTYIYVKGSL